MIDIRENFDLYSEVDTFRKLLRPQNPKLIRLDTNSRSKSPDGNVLTNMTTAKNRVQIRNDIGNWLFALYLDNKEIVFIANIKNTDKKAYKEALKILNKFEGIVKSSNLSQLKTTLWDEENRKHISITVGLKISDDKDLVTAANIVKKAYNYISSIEGRSAVKIKRL